MSEERLHGETPGFPIPITDAREARRTSDGEMNRLRRRYAAFSFRRSCGGLAASRRKPRDVPPVTEPDIPLMTEPAEPGGAGDKVMA